MTEEQADIAPCLTAGDFVKNLCLNNQAVYGGVLQVQDGRPRRFSPKETERLQGWPDDHTRWADTGKEIGDSHRYRMTCNGISSPVAKWVCERLNLVLENDV